MNAAILQKQIARLIDLLKMPDTDVVWSSYDTPGEAVRELEALRPKILAGDPEATARMRLLVAPTGDLQEISISSGWGEEFLGIADAIEKSL